MIIKEKNGQIEVTRGRLHLLHTNDSGIKNNDAFKDVPGGVELIDHNSEEMKPLFIELHNYKAEMGLK